MHYFLFFNMCPIKFNIVIAATREVAPVGSYCGATSTRSKQMTFPFSAIPIKMSFRKSKENPPGDGEPVPVASEISKQSISIVT